jgi:hypothetical protein
MTVSFTNPGLIPVEAIITMGVNVKEGDNPIGFFGTGLKYTIASLLRTGQKITIWRGLDRFTFETSVAEVRGKEFRFIDMTGPEGVQRLGFTTHLGAQWENWQLFRELYSNCLDEQGEMQHCRVEPREGFTTIWVDGAQFADIAAHPERIFLNTTAICTSEGVAIHPGPSNGVYYRGVLVLALQDTALFTYNLTRSMTLTEDRTLKDSWYASYYIAQALSKCDNVEVLEKVVVEGKHYEAGLDFEHVGEVFAETVERIVTAKGLTAVTGSALVQAERRALKEMRVQPLELNWSEQAELEGATDFLHSIGLPIRHKIVVAETLGPNVFGAARNETIYLARTTLNRGGNFLIGTILEEHLHLTHGLKDETRAFQDFLLDLVVKLAKSNQRSAA